MDAKRVLTAFLFGGMLASAGTATPADFVAVDGSAPEAAAGTPPYVEIVVYDGTTLPGIIAGCSAADCVGTVGGQTLPIGTGTVTHSKNYVGWGVSGGDGHGVTLVVDGKSVASVRTNKLVTWSVNNIAAGPHNVQAVAYAPDGTPGWSAPLTITVVK
jgi:hypothetical protein